MCNYNQPWIQQAKQQAMQDDAQFSGGAAAASKPPPDTNTTLAPGEEQKYQDWKTLNAPNASDATYDYRGAYQAGMTADPSGQWPSQFNKPSNPNFNPQNYWSPVVRF